MIQNGQLLAVFSSAHRVMKAENILKKNKLAILLIPAPRALSTDCGLAIRFDSDLFDSVLKALELENLMPTIIYRKNSDSSYEQIWSTDQSEETGD